MHIFVEVVKGSVRQPSFIEMQCTDLPVEQFLEHFDVVNDPIVGTLSDRQDAWHAIRMERLSLSRKGILGNLASNTLWQKLVPWNRANNPQIVSRRAQEYRYRTGHDDRVQNRLVAITVHDDDITICDCRMPNDFVRGGGSVGHKETMICTKNSRSIAFRRCHGAGMVEQLTKFFNSVTHVGPQHVFAKELVKHLPHWAFQKSHATRVTWAVP